MSPRQSAHWYSAGNPPKATELVLAENWLTGTNLHLCQPAPMATPSQRQDFPQLLPPWEEFLSTETGLLLLGNPACTNILLECVLIAKV